jgi:hypothetical protein
MSLYTGPWLFGILAGPDELQCDTADVTTCCAGGTGTAGIMGNRVRLGLSGGRASIRASLMTSTVRPPPVAP